MKSARLAALAAAFLTLAPRPAPAQERRPEAGFESDSAAAFLAVIEEAKQAALPAFGNVPPGVMTDAQRVQLVDSLPLFAGDRGKESDDVVNLAFVGSEDRVKELLKGARWTPVPLTLARSVRDLLGGRLNHFPPFSKMFVRGRSQDMNWNRPVTFESRHHFRLWRSEVSEPLGRRVWVGAAIFDRKVDWDKWDHVADPDVDKERAFVYASLVGNPLVARLTLVPSKRLPAEWKSAGQARFTDGRVLVIELTP
jgi:hypothetical protein